MEVKEGEGKKWGRKGGKGGRREKMGGEGGRRVEREEGR